MVGGIKLKGSFGAIINLKKINIMGGFVNNRLIGQNEFSELEKSLLPNGVPSNDPPESREISLSDAQIMMENYLGNRLDLVNGTDEPIKGFYFDADDIRQLVNKLTEPNTWVFIALAKKSNASTQKKDYTLIATAVKKVEAEAEAEAEFKFYHNQIETKWFEFCKPCPDQCPKW